MVHKRTRNNRKRWALLGAVLVVVIIGGYLYSHGAVTKFGSNATATTTASTSRLPAVESGLLPWQLSSPLSRSVVEPTANPNQLIIAGGLTGSGTTTATIQTLDVSSGSSTSVGSLPTPTHDASGAVIGGSFYTFGGGSTNSIANVQQFSANGSSQAVSNLPSLRSDSQSVTVGGKVYIIGGYTGTSPDPSILSTTNGVQFQTTVSLPIPVRYPAVAALGNTIYIFGGELASGSGAGNPTSAVQVFNTKNDTIATASWKLPSPLEGAMAVTIGNQIYLAGGQSSRPESIQLGVGTTQVKGIQVASQSLTHNTIYAVDTASGQFLNAGTLQVPISNAGVAVIGNTAWLVGGEYNGQVTAEVQMLTPNTSFGYAGNPGAGSPYYGGTLLIADRGNNRLLTLNDTGKVIWHFPSSNTPSSVAKSFYFPDDAFFAKHGSVIISNQEDNNTIVQIAYPSGKIIWSYGHPQQAGSAPGYLNTPDDAYLLKNGDVVVSDDVNCRILFISPNKNVVGQIGKTGVCGHNPGVSLGAPNGDTPLLNGDILVSEIWGSWVSEYTKAGKVVWSVQLPISYPSDPQQITVGHPANSNPNDYMVMDYSNPGAIIEFTRSGRIISKYSPTSGPGRLDHPSLGELLPSNVYMVNDDHRDRVVAIDRKTGALVWQYGVNDTPGTSTGHLQKPDGFDYLTASGTTPTHPATM